jgi:hypothetical protein
VIRAEARRAERSTDSTGTTGRRTEQASGRKKRVKGTSEALCFSQRKIYERSDAVTFDAGRQPEYVTRESSVDRERRRA